LKIKQLFPVFCKEKINSKHKTITKVKAATLGKYIVVKKVM
jgi:hypothetical protein